MVKEELDQKKELVYEYITSKEYRPLKFKEFVTLMQVPRSEKGDLREVLDYVMELHPQYQIYIRCLHNIRCIWGLQDFLQCHL